MNNGVRSHSTTEYMQQFFSDVEIIKSHIIVIKEATRKIADINQNVLQATTTDKEQDFSSELEPLIKATNKKAADAKQFLQALRQDTDAMKANNAQTNKTNEIRIRDNLLNTLTRKFVDVMKDYQNAQTKYKTDIKKKVKRQVQIVKPDATTEEIDAVFKSGGGAGEVFKSAILTVSEKDSLSVWGPFPPLLSCQCHLLFARCAYLFFDTFHGCVWTWGRRFIGRGGRFHPQCLRERARQVPRCADTGGIGGGAAPNVFGFCPASREARRAVGPD